MPRLLLVLFSLTFVVVGQKTGPAPSRWPFGKADARFASDGFDLWNLGVLGAKACDADNPPKERTAGRQAFRSGGDKSADDGPRRLRVDALFPAGPAETGGLKLGDVIIGVNGTPFAKHSMPAMAEALSKAEANKEKPVVTLMLEGVGGKPKTLAIRIPVDPESANPAQPAARAKIAKKALAYLASKQASNGGYPETLSGENGAVVQASMAGLCWLAAGSAPGKGTYAENVEKARDFVVATLFKADEMQTMSRDANWNQTHWRLTYGMMFLAECEARSPSSAVKTALQEGVVRLEAAQIDSGGFGHGPGGANALGYIELNIVGGLVLKALGAAKAVGCKVDDVKARKLLRYLEASGGGDGGVGYSTAQGQKGDGNIGRTAVSWLGALQCAPQDPFTAKLKAFSERNIGDVLGGHASYLQHVSFAGLAACALSPETEKTFIAATTRDLTLNRAPDGSIQPRPWHETVLMGSNSDVSVGDVWSTACQLLPLVARVPKTGPGGLPVTLGTLKPKR